MEAAVSYATLGLYLDESKRCVTAASPSQLLPENDLDVGLRHIGCVSVDRINPDVQGKCF